jgi:hypothetical protein
MLHDYSGTGSPKIAAVCSEAKVRCVFGLTRRGRKPEVDVPAQRARKVKLFPQ